MNQGPFLERRSPLKVTYAFLILLVFFFFIPFGFRAGRLSLGKKENEVQDWLPSDFPETAELNWFADHFAGESFVLATWSTCTSGDQRLQLLEQKLLHEAATYDPADDYPAEIAATYTRAKELGNDLQLLHPGSHFLDWGGRQEKWLNTPDGTWYFITPDGHLYRWDESTGAPMAAWRSIKKALGWYQLEGQFVAGFGDESGVERVANPIYNDPSLLCASLFRSVQTGDSIIDELAREGGALWPVDLTDEDRRAIVARRRAMQRLTGTLFAPAVPNGFDWTSEAFRQAVPQERRDQLPANFDALVEITVAEIIEGDYEGSRESFLAATTDQQTDAWYLVFDTVGVEPPPRLTCVLVTLTELAKENLSYAIGRGVLGMPRGRFLKLAEESGLSPPPAPSVAPPPFDRTPPPVNASVPPLRMGGPPVDNMAIDEEGTITLVRLVGYSVLIGICLSYFCFGSIKITIMLFVVGGSSAILSMAMVWWTGGKVDAVLLSMPSLVYVLGLSGSIHLINYYRDETRKRGRSGAPERALRHAFLPCTLASVTTAIGLISLFTSNLAPISNFGLYSAIGVIVMLAILFSYLPAALETFPPAIARQDPKEEAAANQESRLSQWWAGVGRWIASHHALVSTACILTLLVGSLGLMNIKTSVQLLKLFDSEARIIRDYAWLESNFGKLVPMELILRVPPSMQAEYSSGSDAEDNADSAPASVESLEMLERVEAVSRIRTVVHRTLGEPGRGIVGQAMSADTFLPPLPQVSNSYNPIRNKFNDELLEAREELRDSDFLRIETTEAYADSELWRISLRVAALTDVDYGFFIATLRESVEPVLRAYETRDELLSALTSDRPDGKLKRRTSVLVIGSQRPKDLQQAELISADGHTIDARATYVATLGELLNGERIERPLWIDPTPEQAAALVAKEAWPKKLKEYDAVIWLGGEGFKPEHFAAANHFINAKKIQERTVRPTLVQGLVPDVQGSGPMQVIYTGVVPVVYKAQRTLLTSLANSIALAFVLIAGVMIWLLNPGRNLLDALQPANLGSGIASGMVSMIPNVFPVLLVFGVMCHLGVEIDIGTMMTASVAMGVAVDDTIHFLSWFREYIDRGFDRVEAVIESYRRVGPAMTQTTIVGGLGLFVFALSTFTPTQRFGTLMLVMLAVALVGDLIMLPALLAGPLGRCFKPRRSAEHHRVRAEQQAGETDVLTRHDEPETIQVAPSHLDESDQEEAPIPHLKVHFPVTRKDPPHKVRRK